jgi:lysine 2,3-aminomutase
MSENWRELLKRSVTTAEELAASFPDVDVEEIRMVADRYDMRINPYYMSLIKEKGDPIYRQAVPSIEELMDTMNDEDPLYEEEDSPVPNITHRYPDRVLFVITHQCPMYCRFCTRKRKVGDANGISMKETEQGIEYIRSHPEIRDVILSGGDPLFMGDSRLERIIRGVRAIPHVEIIRIGTKVPCTFPQRITPELCTMLQKYHPLYINTHFNHPAEITPESTLACERLVNAGIPVGNQCVLLKGVNDDPQIMKELFQKLLKVRVRPYYLFQADLVKGTEHFRTSVEKGLEIIQAVRGHTSGLAVPHYVIDAPGGGGKVPLLPHYIEEINDHEIIMRNYEGKRYIYRQAEDSNGSVYWTDDFNTVFRRADATCDMVG